MFFLRYIIVQGRCRVVRRIVRRCLITCIVALYVLLRCSFDSYWGIDYSIDDSSVNVANPDTWVFWSL